MAFARGCKGDTVAYLMLICVTGVSEVGEQIPPSPHFPPVHTVWEWESRTEPGLNLPSVPESKGEWVQVDNGHKNFPWTKTGSELRLGSRWTREFQVYFALALA